MDAPIVQKLEEIRRKLEAQLEDKDAKDRGDSLHIEQLADNLQKLLKQIEKAVAGDKALTSATFSDLGDQMREALAGLKKESKKFWTAAGDYAELQSP